jgi:hypothetical protein
MRIRNATIAMLAATALAACSGDSGTTAPTGPTPPAAPVFLKDIVIPNLPSPYYHFEYGTDGRMSVASFASGFTIYDVTYDHGRVSALTNITLGNQDHLEYVYDGTDRVEAIKYVRPDGVVFTIVFFTYEGRQLTGIERNRRVASGFIIDKTMSFAYYPDGNVRLITEHRPAIEGVQEETTTADLFELYDDKINVDGFGLLHTEFFDHLILLPGALLQKGNPGRVRHTGDGDNYTVDYAYRYDQSNRPLSKTGAVRFATGPLAGRTFQTFASFSYY